METLNTMRAEGLVRRDSTLANAKELLTRRRAELVNKRAGLAALSTEDRVAARSSLDREALKLVVAERTLQRHLAEEVGV